MTRPGWVDRKCVKTGEDSSRCGPKWTCGRRKHRGRDEEIMGRYGAGTRNKEGSMVVDFAKRMNLAIVNIYFKKKQEHRVTYKSGGKSTQVDYVMCRRRNLKEMCNCKVMVNECVAKQHRMVICKMALMVKKKKAEKVKPKIP